VAEHRAQLVTKADQAEVGQLRSQLNGLGHGLAQKVDQLDHDTSEFMASATHKISRLGEQMEQKVASGRLDQLEERLAKVFQAIDKKAEDLSLRRLEEQVILFGECVNSKAERNDVQQAQEKLQDMARALVPKAEKADLEPLRKRLEEVQTAKADSSLVEQLMGKVRTLTSSLTEKAEFAELEQVRIQVHALSGSMAQHKETLSQESEAVAAKLSALTAGLGHTVGTEELQRSVEDLSAEIEKKAETSKLELLISQVEILSDVVTPKLRRGAGARPTTAKKKAHCRAAETSQPPAPENVS